MMMAGMRSGRITARWHAMRRHCQSVWASVGKWAKMGCLLSINWPMPPAWLGKVQTDQKSVLKFVGMEWGRASASASGAR